MIPKTIFFCYKTLDQMSLHTQIWKDLNPEYDIRHYDNEMCAYFLEKEFSLYHRQLFDFLKDGPIKADFWRVCILYKYGGIYSDLDNVPLFPIHTFLDRKVTFCTCSSSWNKKGWDFNPNFIASTQGNPILNRCIKWYLSKYRMRHPYNYWEWSVMKGLTYAINRGVFKRKKRQSGVYQVYAQRIQIIREWKGTNFYGGQKIFNNKGPHWNAKGHCLA